MHKDFYHYLYSKPNVPEMIDEYCAPLLHSSNPIERMRAERLLNYWAILTETTLFKVRIPKLFYQLNMEIEKAFPTIKYEMTGRIKALVSTLNKMDEVEEATISMLRGEFIEDYLKDLKPKDDEEAEKYRQSLILSLEAKEPNSVQRKFSKFVDQYDFKENPFCRIRDFFAFRVVIEDKGTGDMISELYDLANLMIDFFNAKSTFQVVPSHPVIQTGELEVQSPIIHVPEKSGIKPEYKGLVKDYVISPKKNGYQSLHFVVYDPYTQRYFEVQLRTRSMAIIEETLADHNKYKEDRYGKHLRRIEQQIDYSKINVDGFRYTKYQDPDTGETCEHISDLAGIVYPTQIKLDFQHLRAFLSNDLKL